jgi:hypothetical protein
MLKLRRQNKRDTLIIKRICVVMILLLTLGIPSVIFFIAFIITGHLYWAFYRLTWMTISISYAFICLSSVYVTPQIYRPIRVKLGYSEPHTRNQEDSTSRSSSSTRTQKKISHPVIRRSSSYCMIELELI